MLRVHLTIYPGDIIRMLDKPFAGFGMVGLDIGVPLIDLIKLERV